MLYKFLFPLLLLASIAGSSAFTLNGVVGGPVGADFSVKVTGPNVGEASQRQLANRPFSVALAPRNAGAPIGPLSVEVSAKLGQLQRTSRLSIGAPNPAKNYAIYVGEFERPPDKSLFLRIRFLRWPKLERHPQFGQLIYVLELFSPGWLGRRIAPKTVVEGGSESVLYQSHGLKLRLNADGLDYVARNAVPAMQLKVTRYYGEVCSSCLSMFDERGNVPKKLVNCEHYFHDNCINEFLKRIAKFDEGANKDVTKAGCPMCRADMELIRKAQQRRWRRAVLADDEEEQMYATMMPEERATFKRNEEIRLKKQFDRAPTAAFSSVPASQVVATINIQRPVLQNGGEGLLFVHKLKYSPSGRSEVTAARTMKVASGERLPVLLESKDVDEDYVKDEEAESESVPKGRPRANDEGEEEGESSEAEGNITSNSSAAPAPIAQPQPANTTRSISPPPPVQPLPSRPSPPPSRPPPPYSPPRAAIANNNQTAQNGDNEEDDYLASLDFSDFDIGGNDSAAPAQPLPPATSHSPTNNNRGAAPLPAGPQPAAMPQNYPRPADPHEIPPPPGHITYVESDDEPHSQFGHGGQQHPMGGWHDGDEIPQELLDQSLRDEEERQAAFRDDAIPQELLDQSLRDEEERQAALLREDEIPPELLEQSLRDEEERQAALLSQQSDYEATLERLRQAHEEEQMLKAAEQSNLAAQHATEIQKAIEMNAIENAGRDAGYATEDDEDFKRGVAASLAIGQPARRQVDSDEDENVQKAKEESAALARKQLELQAQEKANIERAMAASVRQKPAEDGLKAQIEAYRRYEELNKRRIAEQNAKKQLETQRSMGNTTRRGDNGNLAAAQRGSGVKPANGLGTREVGLPQTNQVGSAGSGSGHTGTTRSVAANTGQNGMGGEDAALRAQIEAFKRFEELKRAKDAAAAAAAKQHLGQQKYEEQEEEEKPQLVRKKKSERGKAKVLEKHSTFHHGESSGGAQNKLVGGTEEHRRRKLAIRANSDRFERDMAQSGAQDKEGLAKSKRIEPRFLRELSIGKKGSKSK